MNQEDGLLTTPSGTTQCPLCGTAVPHEHSAMEIMIYRNGVKSGQREKEALRQDYERACKLVADMHAVAMGGIVGPVLGVVEDVAALRQDAEMYRFLEAENAKLEDETLCVVLDNQDGGTWVGSDLRVALKEQMDRQSKAGPSEA